MNNLTNIAAPAPVSATDDRTEQDRKPAASTDRSYSAPDVQVHRLSAIVCGSFANVGDSGQNANFP